MSATLDPTPMPAPATRRPVSNDGPSVHEEAARIAQLPAADTARLLAGLFSPDAPSRWVDVKIRP